MFRYFFFQWMSLSLVLTYHKTFRRFSINRIRISLKDSLFLNKLFTLLRMCFWHYLDLFYLPPKHRYRILFWHHCTSGTLIKWYVWTVTIWHWWNNPVPRKTIFACFSFFVKVTMNLSVFFIQLYDSFYQLLGVIEIVLETIIKFLKRNVFQ